MRSLRPLLGLVLGAAIGLAAAPTRAEAASAVLTRSGTLYEVYGTTYSEVVRMAYDDATARTPVLALRTTTPDGDVHVEIVEGTFDQRLEGSDSIEYDETTGTLFVVYTQYQGLMSHLHFAVRRESKWHERYIAPNIGLYLSLNPRLVVTRQQYRDLDEAGETVTKSRSILSLIWWEESGISQARYAALFVEDGSLDLDNPVVVNLNDLSDESGPTNAAGLPLSSYQFPSVQRDPASNGGVFVSFANLGTSRQDVFRITFPDDLTKLPETETSSGGKQLRRGRIPITGRLGGGSIPSRIDTASSVGTVLSPGGVPTFYWEEAAGETSVLRYVRGDDADGAVLTLPLRTDFNLDRARSVLRDMVEKQ